MGHRGSKLYRNNQIRYSPDNLKLINRLWEESTGHRFKPDPKVELDDLIAAEVGKARFAEARETMEDEIGDKEIMYLSKSSQLIRIPRDLKQLGLLLLAANEYQCEIAGNIVYIPNMSR